MKINNRFYVAAQRMLTALEQSSARKTRAIMGGPQNFPWSVSTLEGATDHAKELLTADPNLEQVAIVKIIRVVRRETPPIVVEDLR